MVISMSQSTTVGIWKGRNGIYVILLVALLVVGILVIAVPNLSAPLASLGTDQYGVTLTMQLYLQGSSTPLSGSKICGSTDLANPDPTCYNMGLLGSAKDPWTVYDLGSYPPSVTLLSAQGSLKHNSDGSPVANVGIDVSWYYGTQQPSGSFQVFQATSTSTDSNGNFQTQYFIIPSQANGMKIIYFAEVEKGPYSAVICDQSQYTSTAYCFAQSDHYQITVGSLPSSATALTVWVGSGCQYISTLPTVSSTCYLVWRDGKDLYGATAIYVNTPFKIIAYASLGDEPSEVWDHAHVIVIGQTPIEASTFPAKMGSSITTVRSDGATRKLYVLYVGGSSCNPPSSGCDVKLSPVKYDVEFTNSPTPPWLLSSTVLAVLTVGSPYTSWFPTLTGQEMIGLEISILALVLLAAIVGSFYSRKRMMKPVG